MGASAARIRRFFSQTSFLRGIARTRQASLAAILKGTALAGSFADGGMAGAENAWGAYSVHVHGGASQVKSRFTPKMIHKPKAQTRTPLVCLSGQPALKVRLAASTAVPRPSCQLPVVN